MNFGFRTRNLKNTLMSRGKDFGADTTGHPKEHKPRKVAGREPKADKGKSTASIDQIFSTAKRKQGQPGGKLSVVRDVRFVELAGVSDLNDPASSLKGG